jgi:hypothetical protein
MDIELYEKWVTRSFQWIRSNKDQNLPHHIQMLGIVDAELRGIRRQHIFDAQGVPIEDEYGILMLERYQIKAHLWVLGAYEVVRMIGQRLWEDDSLAQDSSIEAVKETKKLFERLRIPLAKLEASKRHKKTDYDVPYAGVGDRGLGWQVSDETIIYQEDLSEQLFVMFSKMAPRI